MPKNEPFPGDVIVRVHEKGWMTAKLMSDWIEVVWQRRPGAMLGGPSGTRSMLLLDAFRGHLTPEVKRTLQNAKEQLRLGRHSRWNDASVATPGCLSE